MAIETEERVGLSEKQSQTRERPRTPSRQHFMLKPRSPQQLARGLGWFSIGLGAAQIAMPGLLAKMIGTRKRPALFRILGLREIASGIGIFGQRRPSTALWSRVGGDTMDLLMLARAFGSRRARRGRLALATAAVGGVTALDVYCSTQMTRAAKQTPVGADQKAFHVAKSIIINRPREELYRFWRDFRNLPRFMRNLHSVHSLSERRSHWVAQGPGGSRIEWDAELTIDKPNEEIGWFSLNNSQIHHAGSVRFETAPGSRGTVVRVQMEYRPPAGFIGNAIASMMGDNPEQQVQEDLRKFKQVMETGEIPTTRGQSHGQRGAFTSFMTRSEQ